jgi:hypothetical protein
MAHGAVRMEIQALINIVLSVLMSIVGWLARELWTAVQNLKEDLYRLREEIAKDYIPKEDFASFKSELFTALRRIEDKLENKEDK